MSASEDTLLRVSFKDFSHYDFIMKLHLKNGLLSSTMMLSATSVLANLSHSTKKNNFPPSTSTSSQEKPNTSSEEATIDSNAVANSSTSSNIKTNFVDEAQIEAGLQSFWELSQGKTPSNELLEKSQLTKNDIKSFTKKLSSENKLSRQLQKVLKQPFSESNRELKFKARNRFINYVKQFQNSFPNFSSVLPEALTAWGETRDLKGNQSEDSLLLQAKMASVIQVLRNRTQKAINDNAIFQNMNLDQVKWQLATQRFQFSSYEPYDPNLSVVALGPNKGQSGNLSAYDQMALKILAKVIFRMSSGDIGVPLPLSQTETRHYITPNLLAFSKKKEKELRELYKSHSRLAVLRIPTDKPKFLAVVPKWSLQKSLISHPFVLIKELTNTFMEQEIPPQDFIFFNGVL